MIQLLLHSTITFIDLTALLTLIGAALCLVYLARPGGETVEYPQVFLDRIQRLLVVCISLLFVGTIGGLIERGIEMSGLGVLSILPVIPTVVCKSHYGSMWLLRVSGLCAAGFAWWLRRQHMGNRFIDVLLLCSGLTIAFSRSASGHPSDFGDLSPQQLADWLHLLAVSSWGGALMALAAIFSPSSVVEDNKQQLLVNGTAGRFYFLFGPLLSVLVLTGLYNAWFEVGSFEALANTAYGRLLSVKLFFVLLLALRYIALPEPGQTEGRFAEVFIRRTRFEAIVVLGVLICVSLLVHKIPARHQIHLEYIKNQRVTSVPEPVVFLDTAPAKIIAGTPVLMTVSIKGPDGKPFKDLAISHERSLHAIIISKDLDFFAHIHSEDIGPVTAEMLKKASIPLLFTFPKAGEYLVGLDFATSDESYSRTFSLNVASDPGMGEPKLDFATKKNYGEYRVTLTTSPEGIRAGEEITLRYVIEKDGKPVTNLEPFLSAAMHLAVVPTDLKLFIHAHGSTPGEPSNHHNHIHAAPPPERFGPEIDSVVVFPVRGVYKVFSQVEHQGKVLLFDFMVKVQ